MRECAPALAALGWLAWIGLIDARSESAPPPRRTWTFSLRDLSGATLQSSRAPAAILHREGTGELITITARPRLLPLRYHGPEPDGREKPAATWNFTWALQRTGGRLTIRALGETREPTCRYLLDELEIHLPGNFPLELTAAPPAAAR